MLWDDGDRMLWVDAAAFSPASVSGLVCWYDFSDAANYTLVSGAYSAVTDKSGNGHNLSQSTPASRPTQQAAAQNGLNTARFTATGNQKMAIASPVNIGASYSVFTVCRRAGPSGTGVIELLGYTGAANSTTLEWWTSSIVYLGSTQGYLNAGTQASTDYNLISATAATNPTNSNVYFNAANIKTGVFTGTPLPSSVFDVFGWGDVTHSNGEIAEVLFYSGVVGNTDRLAIESYLKSKWGTP